MKGGVITEPSVTVALSDLLADLTTIFTAIINKIGDVFGVFLDNPILLLTFGFFFVGGVIGLAMRFLRRA